MVSARNRAAGGQELTKAVPYTCKVGRRPLLVQHAQVDMRVTVHRLGALTSRNAARLLPRLAG
jgi:hypothetical protein